MFNCFTVFFHNRPIGVFPSEDEAYLFISLRVAEYDHKKSSYTTVRKFIEGIGF